VYYSFTVGGLLGPMVLLHLISLVWARSVVRFKWLLKRHFCSGGEIAALCGLENFLGADN